MIALVTPDTFGQVEVAFTLMGAGWLTIAFESSSSRQSVELTVSYTTDAVGDLAWAVADLCQLGAGSAERD